MTVEQNSLWYFFRAAGPVVKAVMLLLLGASIASWTLIFRKGFFLKKARDELKTFEKNFWSGIDLTTFYQQAEHRLGLEGIFKAGFKEFMLIRQKFGSINESRMRRVAQAMRISDAKAREQLEQHLPFLATVGSTAPYVGLFGTVWGIMAAFQMLGQVQQATIAMVAPGISEALIATAMGLFAAIPAVIAYNRYAEQVDRLIHQYDTFQTELIHILSNEMANEVGTTPT